MFQEGGKLSCTSETSWAWDLRTTPATVVDRFDNTLSVLDEVQKTVLRGEEGPIAGHFRLINKVSLEVLLGR